MTRIITLPPSAPQPFALVQQLDLAAGVLVFRWLNAQQQPVDSGGSIARFTPVAPDEQGNYTDVSDATLAAAIANPPAPVITRRQETRVVISRMTEEERAALFGSNNTQVRTLVAMALATGTISDADPDYATGVAGLAALGIIASSRWPALLAP